MFGVTSIQPQMAYPNATIECAAAKGSHAFYVSQPRAVADLIARAANRVALGTR